MFYSIVREADIVREREREREKIMKLAPVVDRSAEVLVDREYHDDDNDDQLHFSFGHLYYNISI